MTGEIALSAALASGVAARWWRRRQRRRRWQRHISALDGDAPAVPDHLSPSLARLALQARVVRRELETPLHRYEEPLVSDTPWGRRRRCADYDLAMTNARLALWEWLRSFRGLSPAELELLGSLGLSLRPFRGLLFRTGIFDRTIDPWEQGLYPAAPDPDETFRELARAMRELHRFERALLGARADPYRA
ncbi:MAG: hypothetical protein H6710_24085 [Myxococcales bacterium]|nr:hypothetical protein [Myxococcales bacterium]MCB9705260.1 hypothetical protein [Myxococcales bacterium]